MSNINITKRPRGRPRKIIKEPEPPVEEQPVETVWENNTVSELDDEHSFTWSNYNGTNKEEEKDFLNELDNEHFKESTIEKKDKVEKVDDIFKDLAKRRTTKPKKEVKSHFEDENSLFDEVGTEILGQERRVLLSKIQQYKNLFPDELKKFKIKKNCSTADLNLYLAEMECIVNTDSVEQFLTDSIIQCIKLTEGVSSYTRHDISGCADMLKGNKQFHTLCKQLYIKYKVFANIPPEFSLIILISTTAYMCKVKNVRKKELEAFLDKKIEQPPKQPVEE